jgi:hypothetical protein
MRDNGHKERLGSSGKDKAQDQPYEKYRQSYQIAYGMKP